jgi:hypothetical protein
MRSVTQFYTVRGNLRNPRQVQPVVTNSKTILSCSLRVDEKSRLLIPAEDSIHTWEAWTAFVWGSPSDVSTENLGYQLELPEQYSLRIVPRDAVVDLNKNSLVKIQYSFNWPKMIIAVVQLVYALISLYRARVHQISNYGYAAFAITVIPYAVMSFVNLISLMFCPDFADLYLVSSSVLREAQDRMVLKEAQDIMVSLRELQDKMTVLKETQVKMTVLKEAQDKITVLKGAQDILMVLKEAQDRMAVLEGTQDILTVLKGTQDRITILNEAQDRMTTVGTLVEEELFPNIQIDSSRSEVGHVTFDKESLRFVTSNDHNIRPQRARESLTRDPADLIVTSPERYAEEGRMNTAEPLDSGQENGYLLYVPCSNPPKRYLHPIRRLWRPSSTEMKDNSLPKLREPWHTFRWRIQDTINSLFLFIFYGITLAIVGGISGFKPGQSTVAQRVWTMLWLVGSFAWVLIDLVGDYAKTKLPGKRNILDVVLVVIALTFMAPAVGGFVVVGRMIHDYGTCTILS